MGIETDQQQGQTPSGLPSDADIDCLSVSEAKALIRELRQRLATEQVSRREAQTDLAAMSGFLAKASHDLRQPLNALGLFTASLAENLLEDATGKNPESLRLLRRIDQSHEAIESLLVSLLDLTKLKSGGVKPDLQRVDLSQIFNAIERRFQPIAQEKGLSFRVVDTSAVVRTDTKLLEKILNHLVDNALKYTVNGKVLLGVRRAGDTMMVIVADTGAGLSEVGLEVAKRPFIRLDKQLKDHRPGLGIGLSIAESAAHILRHRFDIASTLGRGTTCFLSMPLAGWQTETRSFPGEAKVPNERFLICAVDDDEMVLDAMETLIDSWGYGLLAARGVDEVLAKIAAETAPISLLIVDYRLSGAMSGVDVVELLRQNTSTTVPAVLVTGDTDPAIVEDAKRQNCLLMYKPLQAAKLRQVIRSAQAGRLPR